MFISVLVVCYSQAINSCEALIANKSFLTYELCEADRKQREVETLEGLKQNSIIPTRFKSYCIAVPKVEGEPV